MKILISNDDGYRAPGLAVLAAAVGAIYDVVVVAPQENCSGVGNALSLRRSLRVRQSDSGFYYVDGTPADCVHLAITGMLKKMLDWQPDMVIAGINDGANFGDDVLYSGTVAAAIEGRFLGLPALAVSLNGLQHYDTAAEVVLGLLEKLHATPLPTDTILNVNVPDLPTDQLRGLRATRLGTRRQAAPIVEESNTPERRVFRIGAMGEGADTGPGTDFHAIAENAVSVTPLQIDMTRHSTVDEIAAWLR